MALSLPKIPTTKAPLNERIAALRAEIDAVIDEVVEKGIGFGQPRECVRRDLTRNSGCQCAVYAMLNADGKL